MTTKQATPATLLAILKAAQPGDVIHLQPGTYPANRGIAGKWSPRITIDASAPGVVCQDWYWHDIDGVLIKGGEWTSAGPGPAMGYGFRADRAANVELQSMRFAGAPTVTAIMFTKSTNIMVGGEATGCTCMGGGTLISLSGVTSSAVCYNDLSGFAADGIDLADCSDVEVAYNTIMAGRNDLNPSAHPDMIQAWSSPGMPPSARLHIHHNQGMARAQGISLFNHAPALGFEDLNIHDNDVACGYPDGISVFDCKGLTLANNAVSTLPGSQYQSTFYILRSSFAQPPVGNVQGAGPNRTASTFAVSAAQGNSITAA